MAIIALTVSSRQYVKGTVDPTDLVCPQDPSHRLVKDGRYTRHADSLPPDTVLQIQRYYCRSCATTYSALPYDLRPYSTVTWGVMLAVGVVWRQRGWTWAACQRWLAVQGLPYHLRTLQRWAAGWQTALPAIVQAALRWIAEHLGTRALAVFPGHGERPWRHWHRLWQAVCNHPQSDPAARHGGWLGTSVLWGWLPLTVFAGLSPGGG